MTASIRSRKLAARRIDIAEFGLRILSRSFFRLASGHELARSAHDMERNLAVGVSFGVVPRKPHGPT